MGQRIFLGWLVLGFTASALAAPAYRELIRLHNQAPALPVQALQQGLASYYRVAVSGLEKKPVLTIIDYRLASTRKRLWVFDIAHDRLLMHALVAHGRGSGKLYAKRFSNRSHSKQSSLGTFVTEGTYIGHAGLSLRLRGLDTSNNRAEQRSIVVHGARYVNAAFLQKHGYLGRSWGCPAVSVRVAKSLIHTIAGGSVLYAYF